MQEVGSSTRHDRIACGSNGIAPQVPGHFKTLLAAVGMRVHPIARTPLGGVSLPNPQSETGPVSSFK